MTATWFKKPDEQEAFAIGINQGLIGTLEAIAFDVFGYGNEGDGEPLLLGTYDKGAAERVAERVGAFLEIGYPLGNAVTPSPRRVPFVKALVEDAMQFLVLHEFAHILLGHDRGEVHLLRNRMVDLQIATFSIGQEHAADKLAARLHASMRRSSAKSFPGLEFSRPDVVLRVLGLFERYARYKAVFENPHAHPNAYERLYRLRVEFTTGGGHMYWPIPQGDSQTLARTDLEPNPDAVKFSDAIAKSLLSVIEEIEGSEMLPSPFNGIFNRFCGADITPDVKDEFFHEIARWLFLGSPKKVIQHLAEARNGVAHGMGGILSEDNSIFLVRSKTLIDSVIPRINQIEDSRSGKPFAGRLIFSNRQGQSERPPSQRAAFAKVPTMSGSDTGVREAGCENSAGGTTGGSTTGPGRPKRKELNRRGWTHIGGDKHPRLLAGCA